jgi:hypothetical protein
MKFHGWSIAYRKGENLFVSTNGHTNYSVVYPSNYDIKMQGRGLKTPSRQYQ